MEYRRDRITREYRTSPTGGTSLAGVTADRSAIIAAVHTGRALAGILPLLPRSILWAVAKRYVAGSTLEDALRVTAELTGRNRLVTIDVLGEQFSSREQVMAMMAEYERALGELERDHPSATLSLMMTGFGLRLDPHL